jgi:hypothetical protein
VSGAPARSWLLVAAALAALPARARAEDRPSPAAPAARIAATSAPAPEPPPDPAAVEAGDANLEPTSPRKGVSFTAAFGGAASIGFGMANATGRGGAATLRLAHVANARSLVAVEVVISALFFSVSGQLYQTSATNFLVAGQHYLNPALWVRGAVGFGRYGGEQLRIGEAIFRERFRYAGPAGSAGAGVDVFRLGRFRGSVEVSSTAMINRDGVLSSNSLLFGLTLD